MRSDNLRPLVASHRAIVEAIRQAFPDETDADLADSIAGESDLPDAIVAVLRVALEREAAAKAIKDDLIVHLVARARRLEEGARSMRKIALQTMQEAGLPNVKAIDMSVSIGRGKPKVVILDDQLIPDEFCRIVREPLKILIASELNAEREVSGATLGNPQPFLTIHRS